MTYTSLSTFLSRVSRETIDPRQTAQFLEAAKSYRRGDFTAFQRLGNNFATGLKQGIERFISGISHEGDRSFAWLSIEDIKLRDGFKIKELDESYNRWKSDVLKRWQDDGMPPSAIPDLSPEEYVKKCNGGRPRAILDALLGPPEMASSFRPKTKGIPDSVRYPSAFGKTVHLDPDVHKIGTRNGEDVLAGGIYKRPPRVPTRVSGNAAKKLLPDLLDDAKLDAALKRVMKERFGLDVTDISEQRAFLKNHLKRFMFESDNPLSDIPEWADDIDLSGLTEAHVKKLIGNQKIGLDELVHRVFDGQELIDQTLKNMGHTGIDEFWKIPGIHKMLSDVISRSGWEKGLKFEVEQIAKLSRELGPNDKMFLQVDIPNAAGKMEKGPDIVIVRHNNGNPYAEIFQAKSHNSYQSYTGFSGSPFEQGGKDLRRLWVAYKDHWNPGPVIKMPDGTFLPVKPERTFQGDYLRLEAAAMQHERLISGNFDELADEFGYTRRYSALPADDATSYVPSKFPDESYDPLFHKVTGKTQAWTDKMAAWASDTRTYSSNKAAFSELVDKKTAQGKVLQKYIDDLASATPPRDVTVKEIFYAKFIYNNGVIDKDLVQKLMSLDTPITLKIELIQPEIWVF